MIDQLLESKAGTKFELVKEVGIGSLKSSRVFLAEEVGTSKPVCLKIAERDFEREYHVLDELLKLIDNERKKNSGISLPTIPIPHEFGELRFEGQQQHYLSRQFIVGINLFDYFKDHSFESIEERIAAVIDAVTSASVVVEYIHNKGKYHRDLKPYDFITDGKKACLIDFESVLNEGEYCLDMHPLFSAPEATGSIYSALPDHKSDIYSLGMIAFALLASSSQEATREFLARRKSYTLNELNEIYGLGIPDNLMQVIAKATSWTPNSRYDKTSDLVADLEKTKIH